MTPVDPEHVRLLEAMLFASAEPVAERRLAERLPDGADVKAILAALAAQYQGRGVRVVQVDRAWAFRTAPDLAPRLAREQTVQRRISRAAVETLAIIAYHQPVTRAEIEEIRGVQVSKGTMDVLFDEGWIRPRGRRETPGRPVMWATTEAFLDHFGLSRIQDLPGIDDLRAAGLLDARPAVQAYGERAEAADPPLAPDDPDIGEMDEPT